MLRLKLGGLDAANDARRRHAAPLPGAPARRSCSTLEDRDSSSVFHLFPVRCEDRDSLRGHLASAGIETGIHYSPALDAQPALSAGALSRAPFPAASAWAEEELSLPIFPELRDDEVTRVAEAAASF